VALQAGRSIIPLLPSSSSPAPASNEPLIQIWISRIIFWPLPLWVFAVLYIGVCIYALLLWWSFRQNPPGGRIPCCAVDRIYLVSSERAETMKRLGFVLTTAVIGWHGTHYAAG
jgi:hypothetical protein